MDIWKCSRSCTACVWFDKGGVCGKQECEEHNRKPQTTRALTCRWYSKKLESCSRPEAERTGEETWLSQFRNEWEKATAETRRLLREKLEE